MSYIQQNKFKELKASSTVDKKLSPRKYYFPDTAGHETQDTQEIVKAHEELHMFKTDTTPASSSRSRHNVLHTIKKRCVVDTCWQ